MGQEERCEGLLYVCVSADLIFRVHPLDDHFNC